MGCSETGLWCSAANFIQHGKKKKNIINFALSICLTFSPSCLRNEVEVALAVSFCRDLTAEQRSEACKRGAIPVSRPRAVAPEWPRFSVGESSLPYL